MTRKGEHTYQEIVTQPEGWAKTWGLMMGLEAEIGTLWRSRRWERVIFTGCGSPYYLSLACAALFRELTGHCAIALPASELWLNPAGSYPAVGDTLLVAVSRSGATSEINRAVEGFRQNQSGQVVVITCHPESPLFGLGDLSIGLPWAQEQSVAQTRSFASMCVAATAFAAICAGRPDLLAAMERLSDVGKRLLSTSKELMRELGASALLERFYFLGSGMRYGLASEVSLKMKEMTLSHSEPFHVLEFRHGPKSMVNEQTLIVALLSKAQADYEVAVLEEMREMGAQVLALAEDPPLDMGHSVALSSGLPEPVRGVLYLPALHLLAYERALAKGLDPDAPTNLDAVVRLGDA